ncbi:RteC domain-containing protein [Polaribacter septentrionalilitoris]|uniref:RteC domain-containing protein n=1 Tax=Polaribacter septentrionalilitoris TaxID=2494657 RepID=UPI001358EB76|nr:RteC domain-containing protein [Polaribacter septentrionalilitoris]
MKKSIPLVEQYYVQQKKHAEKKIPETEKLNLQLELAKEVLNDLRVYIRTNKFKDSDEEIDFFKNIKPNIYADFIFYNSLLKYHVNKPNTTNSILKNYFKNELKKLESKKRRNLKFYQYYKHNSAFLDHVYFLRENKQLDLFSADLSIHIDSEFYTSHDTLAAEVITYDLLTNFYKTEINKLKEVASSKTKNIKSKSPLNWTASKTDLIELIYALKISGAVNTGHINTKELVTIFSSLFNIDVSNYYKTYSEIKNRNTERSKFLNRLLQDFEAKLEYDDGI